MTSENIKSWKEELTSEIKKLLETPEQQKEFESIIQTILKEEKEKENKEQLKPKTEEQVQDFMGTELPEFDFLEGQMNDDLTKIKGKAYVFKMD